MTDITKHEQIAGVMQSAIHAMDAARACTIADLVRKRDHNEKMLAEANERIQNLPLVIAKYSADIAHLEAMTAADIVRELLPTPEPKQPTVAEHVENPEMYAIQHVASGRWWHRTEFQEPTEVATDVRHLGAYAAAFRCRWHGEKIQAYRLDDLHTVDGLLKIKPGAQPVRFPVRS